MCMLGADVFMFGGVQYEGSLVYLDDAWKLVGDEWSEVTLSTVPSARAGHQMVYDDDAERALMMGGKDASSTFDETWEFPPLAGDFNQLSVSPIENGLNNQVYNHLMVWDSSGPRALAVIPTSFLSGGAGDRVWEFSSGDWSELTLSPEFGSVAVQARYRELMAGCWADDRLLLASGGFGNANYTNDVFELAGTAWSDTVAYVNTFAGGAYPWRFGAKAVWADTEMFLFGGEYNSTSSSAPNAVLGDSWRYDKTSATLTEFAPVVAPDARYNHAMVWTGDRVVLFGGTHVVGGFTLNDTWVLEGPDTPGSSDPYTIHTTFGIL